MKTQDAIAKFGSVRALAGALGISVQAVYGWGEHVPQLRKYQINEILSRSAAAPLPESQSQHSAA